MAGSGFATSLAIAVSVCLAVGCGRIHYSALSPGADGGSLDGGEAGLPEAGGADTGPTMDGARADAPTDGPSGPDAGAPPRILELALGATHTCALLEGGRVRCWGSNTGGLLGTPGLDAIGDDELPSAGRDVELGERAAHITAGSIHTCALTVSGLVYCWGRADLGRLGYGNLEPIGDGETPASVGPVPVGGTVDAVSAGRDHTCALLESGELRCWGMNFSGVLGQGNTEHVGDNEPADAVDPVDVGLPVKEVHSGGRHVCVIDSNDGSAYCWGRNAEGQLGRGDVVQIGDNEPVAGSLTAVDLGGAPSALVAGQFHSCAVDGDAALLCWGLGHVGRLGYGNTENVGDNETPVSVGAVPIGAGVSQVAPGLEFTCALLMDGTVRCFGRNNESQLGVSGVSTIGDDEPANAAPVVELGRTDATAVEIGDAHACALFADGTATCWGRNTNGQLGYGHTFEVGDDEAPASEGIVQLSVDGSG